MSRQWRNMKARLSAGFGHRQDQVKPGDLAVRCPACPQPGVNLPDNWKEDSEQYVPSSLSVSHSRAICRWKYTRTVVMDGNFTAQHRHMKNPSQDVRLADGQTFVVGEERYKEHLKLKQEWPAVSISSLAGGLAFTFGHRRTHVTITVPFSIPRSVGGSMKPPVSVRQPALDTDSFSRTVRSTSSSVNGEQISVCGTAVLNLISSQAN